MRSNSRPLGFVRKGENGMQASTFFPTPWDPVVLSQQHESLNSQATFAISRYSDEIQNPSSCNVGLLPLPKLASLGSGGLSELIGPYTGANETAKETSRETLAGPHGRKRKRRSETVIAMDSVLDEQKSKGEGQSSFDSLANANANASEFPKEGYIHVRARRGQATNSHSLAERVRREKISERMKTLQDLVPGCSKITGKAVMLDEIINYVQSLQQQVEFLSMKLATVNPETNVDDDKALNKEKTMCNRGISHSMSSNSHPKGLYRANMPFIPQTTLLFPPNNQLVFETDLHRFLQPGYDSSSAINSLASDGRMKPEV